MTARADIERAYDRARLITAVAIVALTLVAALLPASLTQPDPRTFALLMQQDIWLAPVFAGFCFFRFKPSTARIRPEAAGEQRLVLIALAALLFACWVGH